MTKLPGRDMLPFWRKLEESSILQCPACRASIKVTDLHFECRSCLSVFPVEGSVPLFLRPDDVVSIPDEVIRAFNIPSELKDRVEMALTPLIKYRTSSYPEFANFFARFDPSAISAQSVPLNPKEAAEAIVKVDCLTRSFPKVMRSGFSEFRSIRLRNRSEQVLLTDDRTPLFISYRIFTSTGDPVPGAVERSKIPSPLRPGSELTVPVMVRLPAGVTGQLVIRFYFLLASRGAWADEPALPDEPRPSEARWMSTWRDKLTRPRIKAIPDNPVPDPEERTHWFDASPLAEMVVTASAEADQFPAIRRDRLRDFEVHEDVARADRFLMDVIAELKVAGVSHPRILEVGAGVHPISLRACGRQATVIVSDISLVMQTLAAFMHMNNPAVLEGRAAFASLDIMYPPFRDGTFDIICICAALHHIPCPDEFLRRLAPMLSPQGRFVAVREPCLVNPTEPTYISELANGFNEQMFELSEWKAIVSGGGFTLDGAVVDFDCSLKFSARASSSDDILLIS
jgi:SAM-dependent methyltransferase